jgi:exodeoxyribonuclease-3
MIVATWNINSIKVRIHAVIQYLVEYSPDVLVVQETKSIDENFPCEELKAAGYHSYFCGQPTYNGVAIIYKKKLNDVELNPVNTKENQQRSIAATYKDLKIINLYVVNGQNVGTEKFEFKMRWLGALKKYIKACLLTNKKLIILGDFNIAPSDNDVFDIELTKNQILCSPDERKVFRDLLSLGLNDLFLHFDYPPKTFTWWDYRGGAFHKNIGYRIDHILGTPLVSDVCKNLIIDKETRHKSWCKVEPRTSDHAPVRVTLDF